MLARVVSLVAFLSVAVAHGQDGPAVRDIGPASIAAFEKLGASYLRARVDDRTYHFRTGFPLTGECVPAFSFAREPTADLPNLPVPFALHFAGGALPEARVKQLVQFKNLIALDVRGYLVTDSAMKQVAQIKSLRALAFYDSSPMTNAGLKKLAELPNLSVLYLWHTCVDDDGLKELARFKNLRMFSFDSDRITDNGLRHLQQVPCLQTLNLPSNRVADTTFRVLGEIGRLHTLEHASAKDQARPRSAEDVVSVDLTYAPQIGDLGLKELGRFKNLERLTLNKTKVSDAGLKELAAFPKLASLHLAGTAVTDNGLRHLEKLASLTELNVQQTGVTDAGVLFLREALPNCKVHR